MCMHGDGMETWMLQTAAKHNERHTPSGEQCTEHKHTNRDVRRPIKLSGYDKLSTGNSRLGPVQHNTGSTHRMQ